MRINDTYGRFNGTGVDATRQGNRAQNAPKTDGQDAAAPPAAGGADEVSVSAKAHELATKAAEQHDAAKIESLRASIADGTFKIDKQAIAKRIVDGG